MFARGVLVIAGLIGAIQAQAGELRPEEAKRFVAGKTFAYTCFEGTMATRAYAMAKLGSSSMACFSSAMPPSSSP